MGIDISILNNDLFIDHVPDVQPVDPEVSIDAVAANGIPNDDIWGVLRILCYFQLVLIKLIRPIY